MQARRPRPRSRTRDVPVKPVLVLPEPLADMSDSTQAPGADAPLGPGLSTSAGTDYAPPEEPYASSELTVPMELPDRSSLAMRMVPHDLVYQLLEYKADGNRLASIFWSLVGGAIGVAVNWATSYPAVITPASVATLACLVVFGSVISYLWYVETKRAAAKLKELENFRYSSSRRQ